MKRIVQIYKKGDISVEEVPIPGIQPAMVLVQNAFSVISTGTERARIGLAKNNLLQKARSRPDDLKKVINLAKKQGIMQAYKTAMESLETPTPLGYSSAGIVIEIGNGVDDVKPGDRVACAGSGYASHSEVILVPKNLCAKVPEGVPLDWAAFTTLGAIALQGVRQADVKIGENIAVIGVGLLGQLTIQILKASGCRVFAMDIDNDKIDLAKKMGADFGLNVKSSDHVSTIRYQTSGIGVDAVIITADTAKNDPFLLAPKIARDRAKVVLIGVAKISFPREPYYRKELSVILSRSYGPGRYDPQYEEGGIDYPIGYVRWTEKRNLEAVLQLMVEKKIDIEPLITHRFKIEDAQKAYDLILGKTKEKFLGVLFEYERTKEHITKIFINQQNYSKSNTVHQASALSIGFIGPGQFARSYLLPNIIKNKEVNLVGVASAQGASAKMVAQKYGFKYCTSNYNELLNDNTISTIFIATRHNLHAQLIIDSIKAGKNVFCEKPLCLNIEELNKIIKLYNYCLNATIKLGDEETRQRGIEASTCRHSDSPILMLGFNRRFAPLTIKAKEFLGNKVGPYTILYRINAGELPPDHWLLDPMIGGGRIIGEVCHFVDLISYFIKSKLNSVYAHSIGDSKYDISATLSYQDGSTGLISYFSTGDKDFTKERIEIFGDGKACIIDDFRELVFSSGGKTKKIKKTQDKGHKNEIIAFFEAIKNGKPSPISFSEIVEATLATFAIVESLKIGMPVKMSKLINLFS